MYNYDQCLSTLALSLQVTVKPVDDIEEELQKRRQYAKHRKSQAYDSSDDEEQGGRQRVQCAQQ